MRNLRNWVGSGEGREFSAPKIKTVMRAKKVVTKNLKPVIKVWDLFWSRILEKVVDEPQATAAPNARSAAVMVSGPVLVSTKPFLKVTKKAETRAIAAQIKYFFWIFSLRKMTAVEMAKIG